ncbi:c-type cytochrome [uncultured Sunxiuqinia sp.]|uniref:c-type cytochrome n=1 Tax=Sunxiuqinia rutila TaxID=1397841 RepID=UPI00260A2E8C|nr:cytochrome c [uncultured Sunxiuqinia sp.]
MKKYRNLLTFFVIVFVGGILLSFVTVQDKVKPAPWDIPEKYQKMENPYVGDESLERVGKILYIKHCRSCHGNNGEGDGPKAASMKTEILSFTSEKFKEEADGVVYFQSIIGRDEMPNYESKIPEEEDRWALVNYIKAMKK